MSSIKTLIFHISDNTDTIVLRFLLFRMHNRYENCYSKRLEVQTRVPVKLLQ